MGLNIKKLRSMQDEIKNKSGSGERLLLFASELPEEQDIRILPPLDNMNGVYFLEQEGWWINGKFILIDPDNDVIAQELDMARVRKDETLDALINKKKNGMPVISKEVRYSIPILTLESEYDDNDDLISCNVTGTKVLIAKPTLMRNINKIVTARPYQNGTEWGIADRVKGYNLIIGKQGKGLDTEYTAMGWNEQVELPEKHYKQDAIPDILGMHDKALKSEEYQRSIIRNYLYGEAVKEEEDSNDAMEKATPEPKAEKSKKASPKPKEEVEPEEVEKPKKKKRRSLLDEAADDMMDMD